MKAKRYHPPLDPAQAEFLRKRAEPILKASPRLAELRCRLLEVGGHEVVWMESETDLTDLLDRGRAFPPNQLRQRFMEDSVCHENAASLWFESKGNTGIATGYAMSSGLWLQHSWGVEDGRIIETTSARREAYFGFDLTDEESLRFAFNNLPPALLQRLVIGAMARGWPWEIVERIASSELGVRA